jgi:arylsulfatase A-like enzyme
MNVLVYVVDALRADHLSSYGYDRETTPNIDALCEDGIRYEQCFSTATWTRPASVSLLTGAYPPTHGVRHREHRFPPDLPRLPQLLSEAGYETVGISTMGNVSTTLGYDVGFDSYHDLYKDDDIIEKRKESSTTRERLVHEDRDEIALPRAEDITERLEPIYDDPSENLFAFCWSIDPHMPLDPPEGYRTFLDSAYDGPINGSFKSMPEELADDDISRLIDLYDSEISYVDAQIGAIVDELQRKGLYDETLLVVVGDHGEAFHEHETIFHGNVPYDEVLHVPLVIKPPGSNADSGTVSDMVSIVDICPTILDVLDIDTRPACVQGQVVAPFNESPDDVPVFSETQLREFKPAYRTVRTDRWKYINTEWPPLTDVIRGLYAHRGEISNLRFMLATLRDSLYSEIFDTEDELLYEVSSDPCEQRTLAAEQPEKTAQYRSRLDEWLDECATLREDIAEAMDTEDEIDAATAEQLKQLGYVD